MSIKKTRSCPVLPDFPPISLGDMKSVAFMNRMDTKYIFHSGELPGLLRAVKNDYFVLEIGGRRWHRYATQYFDTPDDLLYLLHHNGKMNRYKIRRRDYVDSEDLFLEMKFKTNRGRTIKKRIETTAREDKLQEHEDDFIAGRLEINGSPLVESLKNRFHRLTLVALDLSERSTIDLDLQILSSKNKIELRNLVICEIKSEKNSGPSSLKNFLKNQRIKPLGFSKYCIGRALTDQKLKQNSFKEKLRKIEKITHGIHCTNA